MKKSFKIVIVSLVVLFTVSVVTAAWFHSLDSYTKRCLIYGKNICNFYEMMEMNVSDENFGKMVALCGDMYDVPKKDSCFEVVAQSFARIDMEKAKEACDRIRGFSDTAGNLVHTRQRCHDLIREAGNANISQTL